MDYLFAYSTTGARPAPCPENTPLPGTEAERASHGLSPPIFTPTLIAPQMEAEHFLSQFTNPSQAQFLVDHPMADETASPERLTIRIPSVLERQQSLSFSNSEPAPGKRPLPPLDYVVKDVPTKYVDNQCDGRTIRKMPMRRRPVTVMPAT